MTMYFKEGKFQSVVYQFKWGDSRRTVETINKRIVRKYRGWDSENKIKPETLSVGMRNRFQRGLKNAGECIDGNKQAKESKIPRVTVTYAYGDWDSNPGRGVRTVDIHWGMNRTLGVKYNPGRQQG